MPACYIVCERYFDYNDEIYTAEGGGTPIFVSFDRDEAEKYCKDYNLNALKNADLREYCYDVDEILNMRDAHKIFPDLTSDDIREFRFSIEDCTEDQLHKLLDVLHIDFAFVHATNSVSLKNLNTESFEK